MKKPQGQLIVDYKGQEELIAVLSELKKAGFRCNNKNIDLETSPQSEIDKYLDRMPMGIDFEKRVFFHCGVMIAIHARPLFVTTEKAIHILKKKKRVPKCESVYIYL